MEVEFFGNVVSEEDTVEVDPDNVSSSAVWISWWFALKS